jgi:hypothetical protein
MEAIGPITDAFRIFNYVEAGWWAAIGAAFAVHALRKGARQRTACVIATISFLAFGGSDVIEARTGAWWHPWWLLVWKGLCLALFAGLIVRYAIDPARNARASR